MKITGLILAAVFILADISTACAQVVDMRAYSRQRGFKAYSSHQSAGYAAARQPVRSASAVKQKKETAESEKKGAVEKSSGKNADQTDEMKEYIENNPHVKPDI